MDRKFYIIVLSLLAVGTAEARRYVPLMPKRLARNAASSSSAKSYRLPELGAGPDKMVSTEPSKSSSPSTGQALGLGAELGALASPGNGSAGFAPGGRAYLRVPIAEGFYLKPSLGYFYQATGTAAAPITRHVFELGATFQYSLIHSGTFRLLGGIAARVDLAMQQEYDVFGLPTSSLQTLVRGGPSLGALYGIGSSTSLSFDVESTFTTSGKFLLGASAGIVFYLR